ncbi:MAG: hypothetical protein E7331_07475 [Clostridiales bacterium]|nr:hypothetical protein [Clostridiales bacterium]
MASHVTSYVHYPFVCRWQCVHCTKENVGRGTLTVEGDMVGYSPSLFHNEERVNEAAERSREGINGNYEYRSNSLIQKVNVKKKYHKELSTVQDVCHCCGKKQPWQFKSLRGLLGKILLGYIIVLMAFCFCASQFFPEIFNHISADILTVPFCVLLLALIFISPIQRLIANIKMKKYRNTPYFPEILEIKKSENKPKKKAT